MQVKTIGMQLSVTGDKTIRDFLLYLKNEPITPTSDNRILVIDEIEANLWVGCLLSFRDERVLLKYRFENGVYTISAEELEEGSNKIDVNFFLINSSTSRGLFQLYFHSASFNILVYLLKTKFQSMKSIQQFRGKFSANELLRNETIDEWLEKIERIKSIEVDFDVSNKGQSPLGIMKSQASSSKVHFSYKKTTEAKMKQLKRAVSRLYRTQGESLKRFLVKGVTAKLDEYFDLTENVDVFHYQEYDEFAKKIKIESSDLVSSIRSSENISELIKIYNTPKINRHIG